MIGVFWEKENLSTKSCTGIGMKISERKNGLIKNNIAGNINSPGRNVEALVAFVHVTIANESTLFGSKLKFPFVVRTEVWPNGTPEGAKKGEIWFFMK